VRVDLRSRTEWLGSCSHCKIEVVTRGAFLAPRMNCDRLARGSGRLWRGCAAGMRAADADGARNQRRHDDANSPHLNSILVMFQFFFRHTDNCPERDRNDERVCVCSCVRRRRDVDAIAERADFSLFVAETYCRRQRSRKTFPRFAASFRATGRGAMTRGAAVRSTIRGSLGAEAWNVDARRAIISSEAEAEAVVGGDGDCR
jgi:hypothetical protein